MTVEDFLDGLDFEKIELSSHTARGDTDIEQISWSVRGGQIDTTEMDIEEDGEFIDFGGNFEGEPIDDPETPPEAAFNYDDFGEYEEEWEESWGDDSEPDYDDFDYDDELDDYEKEFVEKEDIRVTQYSLLTSMEKHLVRKLRQMVENCGVAAEDIVRSDLSMISDDMLTIICHYWGSFEGLFDDFLRKTGDSKEESFFILSYYIKITTWNKPKKMTETQFRTLLRVLSDSRNQEDIKDVLFFFDENKLMGLRSWCNDRDLIKPDASKGSSRFRRTNA
jgi:hypothetical protein